MDFIFNTDLEYFCLNVKNVKWKEYKIILQINTVKIQNIKVFFLTIFTDIIFIRLTNKIFTAKKKSWTFKDKLCSIIQHTTTLLLSICQMTVQI